MDRTANRRVIVLSIHPSYGEAILAGTKTVEFRRNGVPETAAGIVIYATSPVQALIGYVEVADCIVSAPSQLWRMFSAIGGISRADFSDYYSGYEVGKCYRLGKPFRFAERLSLEVWAGLRSAPQSFAYMPDDKLATLLKRPELRAVRT